MVACTAAIGLFFAASTAKVAAQAPNVVASINFDPTHVSGDSYTVQVGSAQISAGKTLTAHFDFVNHKVKFKDNDINADTYDVEGTRTKSNGTRRMLKKEFKEEGAEIESNFDEWTK